MEKKYLSIFQFNINLIPGFFKRVQFFPFLLLFSFILTGTVAYGQFPDSFAKVELASGLSNTTSFEFAPDGRIFILDRYGEVLIYDANLGFVQSAGTIDVFHEQEDGLLAIEFDPNFTSNNFIYLYYSPDGVAEISRVSRFTLTGGATLDNSSEVVLLEWPTDRSSKYHSGGDMAYDSNGNLYISTGDNTTYPDTYTAIALQNTDTPTNRDHSAEKSSSDTNAFMGKVLRITPQVNGTYTIPSGNLFPGGTGGLPEIYVMGARNPYRIFVDKDRNDWLYWGEVGPDAQVASARGPIGMDELNLTKQAGNFGWPYFSGNDNLPYQVVYNGSPPFYNDPLAPVNTSIFNTGATDLPPAQPSLLSFGGFFKCVMSGFRYDYDPGQTDQQRLPIEFDDAYFFFDFNTSRIYVINLDVNGNVVQNLGSETSFSNVPQFGPSTFPASTEGFIDMELGPDGKMYILAYGVPCCSSDAGPSGKLYRVDYTGITTNSPPVIQLSATPTNGNLPLVVNFSTAGTTDPDGDSPLTYEWDFDSNGTVDSTDPNPTHTYTTAGTFNAQVKVNDGNPTNGQSIKNVTIYAGNNLATYTINSPVVGGLFNWGDDLNIDIEVVDEGLTVDCNDVVVVPGFGHLNHVHPEPSINGCPQVLTIEADDNHGTEGQLDIFGSISLEYTDPGGLISRDLITIHPKRKEAEFFSSQNGTTIIPNNDPLEGGQSALRVNDGSYMSLDGRNLLNMTAVKYRVAANSAGGTIELRLGSPTGSVLVTTPVPATGGPGSWVYIETPITDPGGTNDLFFVFNGSGSNIFDLDYIEFIGAGISTDNSPPIVENVNVVNPTTVAVTFSEYLNEVSAETLANYSIDNGITISAVNLQVDDRTVYLTTSALSSNISYVLTVQNVQNTSNLGIPLGTYSFSVIDGVRVNAGGGELVVGGETFIADNYNAGGSVFDTTEPIEGTTDDALYQTERFGPGGTFGYEIPVGASSEYDIRLHFAEIYYGLPGGGSTGGVGSRIFNVSIEGIQVLTNFDILSEVNPATALTKEFNNVQISDGAASIVFTGIVESPKVSALEVLNPNTFDDTSSSDITIVSPSNGWDVNQPFEVAFTVENWTILEGDTHMHYYIDDMMVGPYYSYEPISIDGLSLGAHTIKLELFNADHTGTGIFDEVTVNVTGAITCNTTPFPDQWGVKQLETTSLPQVSVYTFADFDFDGDGLKDIVTGGWWYKNPGTIQGTWARSTIGTDFDNVVWVYDFDGDGDLDLLGTTDDGNSPLGYQGSDLVWAQNDGSGGFTVFTNIPSGNTTYNEPFLAGIAGGVFSVGGPYQMAINWNGAETSGSPMQMLTPTTDPTTGTWSLVDMVGAVSTGEDIQAGDIDQDNDLDLFQGTNWIRNNGGTWETISTGISYVTTADRAQLADFDRDGDLDAVVGQLGFGAGSNPARFEFAWWEAPADPTQPWTKRVLDPDVKGSLSVFATDIDFDGDKDIVVGEWLGQYRLIVFENDLCDSGNFIKQVINDGIPGQEHHDGARVTDLDNDGDLDVVSNGWFVGSELRNFPRIYENQTVPVADDEPIVDAGPNQDVLPGNTTLNGSASDPDGGAIVSYQWTQVSGPSTATLTGDTTETLVASDLIEGVYVFRLTATDDETDTGFDEATITVSNQSPAIRINSGGPTYTFNSTTWSEDQYFTNGTIVENAIAIANTDNDQLYQTERFHTGDLIYEIPVSNGDHNVNLHFAEIFYGVPGAGSSGGVGSRIFNVDIEGGQGTLTNYDIIAEAGGSATAIIENFTDITVNDGSLTITLTGVTEFPKISGIEVVVPGLSNAPMVFAGDDRTITLPNNSLTLDGSATDPDGGAIASYIWTQVSGPNTATFSSTTIEDPDISDLVEGDYVFRLTAIDDENDMGSDEVTITVASEPSSLLINSGGPAFTFNTQEWTADQYFVGGSIFEEAIAIANTENDELYQTERFSTSGTLVYEIPVINGNYNVDLHFAELFYGVGSQAGGVGSRIFNIQVENEAQISNYDIVAAAGGSATAIIESLTNVPVTDGMLTITLTSVVEFPKISGIGVYETRPPDVNAGSDQTITLPTNSTVLNGMASDPDGGMLTYQWTQESGPGTATLTGADTADLTASDLVEGEYVFRLSVTDDEGEMAFDEVTVTVVPEGGMGDAPVAVAEATPTSGAPRLLVTFTGSNSTDNIGIASYLWDFGDGTTSTEADLEKIYEVSGTYEVMLTVTDDGGLTDTATLTITVVDDPTDKMDIILQSNPPNPTDGGFAHIQVINQPTDMRVLNITLHDVGGRYLGGYLAQEIEQNGVYRLPVATLGDGIYFVRIAMSEGKPTLIKLWIRN
ncbi:PKD domain-containing protein [Maribacter algarum]|uniref:PKD domain-containing protein n=1 Tax=Maribacter algarum (ex Zhang et al. 2020) TaxID=2578118 RepID=A0A5S3PHM3_9FLAO|nr:malectin domain-containing carbohydrate-binding protein [Maribacter algarum]TMM53774.1 PKD domain-containing protein [Maribacter algarum]